MAKSDGKLPARIGVVAYPGCSSWIAAGLLEIFAIANLVLGQFAVGFRYFGDRAATARVFQRMDRRAVLQPWSYLDESAVAVAAARLWAGGGAK